MTDAGVKVVGLPIRVVAEHSRALRLKMETELAAARQAAKDNPAKRPECMRIQGACSYLATIESYGTSPMTSTEDWFGLLVGAATVALGGTINHMTMLHFNALSKPELAPKMAQAIDDFPDLCEGILRGLRRLRAILDRLPVNGTVQPGV